MAKNQALEGTGAHQSMVVTSPASPVSGYPCRINALTGVALTDLGAGGNGATYTTVDIGMGVYDLIARAVDDNGASAISLYDPLYFTDGDVSSAYGTTSEPYLSKKSSGYFFGFANEAITSGYDRINVTHMPAPGSGTLGSATVTNSMLAAMASAYFKVGNGSSRPADVTMSGDATMTNSGVVAVGAGKVTEAMLQVPTAIGLGVVRTARAKYSFAVDGGVSGLITPASNSTIPINAIIWGGLVNVTSALTSGGSATIAIGTSAGSSANSLKLATAVATYSSAAILPVIPVQTAGTAIKLSAAGAITITVAAADLTAGVMDIILFYVVASA